MNSFVKDNLLRDDRVLAAIARYREDRAAGVPEAIAWDSYQGVLGEVLDELRLLRDVQ
jgi:hypothetical protein